MKIKIRPDDAGVLQEEDWLQADDWLAALSDDGHAARPAMATSSRRAAAIPGRKFLLRPLPVPRQLPVLRPLTAPR